MPDPPIMPSTAVVMTSPDVLAAAPYSTNVVWPQVTPSSCKERPMSTTSDQANDKTNRQSIIAACRDMNRLGINQGTSGNISLRHQDGMLITPTSTPYETMQPDDIVFMKLDGAPGAKQRPSSEWRFHRDILNARPEVNAVVHAHSPFATILAIMGREIPPIHYMIAS